MPNKDRQKEDALSKALESGVITQKEYNKKFNVMSKSSVPKPSREPFSWAKFRYGMFSLLDPVEWSQTLRELGITDVRKWIMVALILGGIYGYGYVKGVKNKPVHFDMRGQEAHIALNEHYLHITSDGSATVEDDKGNVLKTIRVGDIPELKKALMPIGFDIKPFFTTGAGMSAKKGNLEAGVGVSVFKIFKVHLDTFLTSQGAYLGADYKVTDNFGALIGGGMGYDGNQRVYFGGKWNF